MVRQGLRSGGEDSLMAVALGLLISIIHFLVLGLYFLSFGSADYGPSFDTSKVITLSPALPVM